MVLDTLVRERGWSAVCVLSAVGSLRSVALRFANQEQAILLEGPHEVVSLTGTLGPDGSHLHLAVSDGSGHTLGGHLKEGSAVHTTLEMVLGILDGWVFSKKLDPQTGYLELSIAMKDS